MHGTIVGYDDLDENINYVYSGLGYIYLELGSSVTWDSCYSGGGC